MDCEIYAEHRKLSYTIQHTFLVPTHLYLDHRLTKYDASCCHREQQRRSGLIKSCEAWHIEMAKWVQEEQAETDSDEEDDGRTSNHRRQHHRTSKWLPRSLDLLFSGRKETDVDVQLRRVRRQTAYTEEARLMELLADEEADVTAIPDDGELEGSGDDFYC